MIFRRHQDPDADIEFPGEALLTDGRRAAGVAAALAGATVTGVPADGGVPTSWPAGHALVGRRATAAIGGDELAAAAGALRQAAGQRLSFVLHVACRALTRQATPVRGGHDDYHAVADSGCFQLFARNVQEAADLALIAHRLAELALVPGLCAQDADETSHSLQVARLPERELVRRFLGSPDDQIPCPTPAQEILFGNRRRRIPRWLDPDRPAGIGPVQDHESFFRATAAQHCYFLQYVAGLADEAFAEYGHLTGRAYARAKGYRVDDAETVIVAQGAVTESLRAAVDHLRDDAGVKAGVVNLTMFRPFPGDLATALLKGKKTVTVLERTDRPLAEDPPILREVRAAIDKAVENGRRKDSQPYPEHAVYTRASDRPELFSAIYGVGARGPSLAELIAAFRNMDRHAERKRAVYLGVRLGPSGTRLPLLATLEQSLQRACPEAERFGLTAVSADPPRGADDRVVHLHSIAGAGGTTAARLLARCLNEARDWQVRTQPSPGASMQPTRNEIAWAMSGPPPPPGVMPVDTIMVTNEHVLDNESVLPALAPGGILLAQTERDPAAFWQRLAAPQRDAIRAGGQRLYIVNARLAAADLGMTYGERMASQALVGAFLAVCPELEPSAAEERLAHYRNLVDEEFAGRPEIADANVRIAAHGYAAVQAVPWRDLPEVDAAPGPREPEAPWPVARTARTGEGPDDRARFWHSVSFLYQSGRADQLPADPFLATGIVPAQTSASRSMALQRTQLPNLRADRCTGCGVCWMHCPDSALPATVQDFPALLTAAMRQCENGGRSLEHLPRVAEHLARETRKLFAGDASPCSKPLGEMIQEAWSRLATKIQLDDSQREALGDEIQDVARQAADARVVRTDRFFAQPEARQRGTGLALMLTVNPETCKECGQCAAVCPEAAWEIAEQDDNALAAARRRLRYLQALPETPAATCARFTEPDDASTLACHLLNRRAYHSTVGGDGAMPGSGPKTALHLVTAAAEVVMQDHLGELTNRLDTVIARLREGIQESVRGLTAINDFEQLGRTLDGVDDKDLAADDLAKVLAAAGGETTVDRRALARRTRLANELTKHRDRFREDETGPGRARLAVVLASDATLSWCGTYPYNPGSFPWVHSDPTRAADVAEGIAAGLTHSMATLYQQLAAAERELAGEDSAAGPAAVRWETMTEVERNACPPVLVVLGEDAFAGEGIEGVLRLIGGRLPIKALVLDNAAGATVGLEASATRTTEAPEPRRLDVGLLGLACRQTYVLQTSVGTPGHLLQGVMEGLRHPGPALFHVCAPEPSRHGVAPSAVPTQGRLAVAGRAFPLFRYAPSRGQVELDDNPAAKADWPSQVEGAADGEAAFTFADWAAREQRFDHHFAAVPRGERHENMLPLADYLALAPADRDDRQPTIVGAQADGRVGRLAVSPVMAAATEARLHVWRFLQELAGERSPLDRMLAEARAEAAAQRQEAERVRADCEARAQALEEHHDGIYHQRLVQRMQELCYRGWDPDTLGAGLRTFLADQQAEPAETANAPEP